MPQCSVIASWLPLESFAVSESSCIFKDSQYESLHLLKPFQQHFALNAVTKGDLHPLETVVDDELCEPGSLMRSEKAYEQFKKRRLKAARIHQRKVVKARKRKWKERYLQRAQAKHQSNGGSGIQSHGQSMECSLFNTDMATVTKESEAAPATKEPKAGHVTKE